MVRMVFALFLVLCMTACGKEEPPFNWQVDSLPTNLDPQVAQGESNLLALSHLFRGLYRLDESGTPVPDGCLHATHKGLHYRFILSRGEFWSDGEPVRAADYAFALRRCLDPNTGSPYREQFSPIESIEAPGPYILEITVTEETDLPRLLACPGAYPCREGFFAECQGQYGLTRKTVLGNGNFTLQSWGSSIFTLTGCGSNTVRQLRLILPDSSLPVSGQVMADPDAPAAETWVLALNPGQELLQNLSLRKAICGLIRQTDLPLSQSARPTAQLLPPIYRQTQTSPTLGDYQAHLWDGMDQLGRSTLEGLSILTTCETRSLAQAINQQLEAKLGIFCTIRECSPDRMEQNVQAGNYCLAIYPLRAKDPDPLTFWTECSRLCGLEQASSTEIMESCCLAPLFTQGRTIHTDESWSGAHFYPFSGLPDFTGLRYTP